MARVFSYGEGFQQWGYVYLILPKTNRKDLNDTAPLDWYDRDGALAVLKVPGTMDGYYEIDMRSLSSPDFAPTYINVEHGRLSQDLVVDWIKEKEE